ncbi:MAG: hypothetical protein QG641_2243, partial [Candidatus Poribacteria bacterium]|nr:hypothetical protein [Candidatus Poribacteria bacterium]
MKHGFSRIMKYRIQDSRYMMRKKYLVLCLLHIVLIFICVDPCFSVTKYLKGEVMSGTLTRLSDQFFVYHGSINVGILCSDHKTLLIDFGDGSVISFLDKVGIKTVDAILFTHHHRD